MKRIRNAKERRPIYAGLGGKLAQAVDGTVGIVAPRLAHRMRVARIQNEAVLAYEAAKVTRTEPHQASASADAEILPDLRRLRDVSRNMIRDDAHTASAVQVLEENIIGSGVRPQSICTPDATGMTPDECMAWRNACEAHWEEWAAEEADATEQGTFYELQALVLRCLIADGDAIGHAVVGGDGLIACELIDADRMESPNFTDTDTIRGGVELGTHGEPVAYHILQQHPDDRFVGSLYRTTPVRIIAEDGPLSIVQHVYRRTRPGQTRGVPLLSASAGYSRHLHHYLNSELIAARVSANYAMFIKRAVSQQDADIFPVANDDAATGQHFVEEIEPGSVEYLNEGEEPVAFTPNRPGNAFTAFTDRILRAIAASLGLSYEMVAKDYGQMNLSSARALLRECRRGFDQTRSRIVRQFCMPWWSNVITMGVQSGKLRPPGRFLDDPRPFLAVRWVAPSYGMVDPVTDVEASVAAVQANLSTPYEESARNGMDAEQVLRDRARFLQRAAEIEAEHDLAPGTLTTVAAPGAKAPAPMAEDDMAPMDTTSEDATSDAADAADTADATTE